MAALLTRQARSVSERLRAAGSPAAPSRSRCGLHDFTTLNRSTTIGSPTDAAATIGRLAVALLQDLDTTGGVRLLGVGVSGLADWIQEDLFGETVDDQVDGAVDSDLEARPRRPAPTTTHTWAPGMDVEHAAMGRGWVWGSGAGVVTVRFETAETGPGPVRSYPIDEPDLKPWRPEPLDGSTVPGHARTTSLTTPRPPVRIRIVRRPRGRVRRAARAHPGLPGLRPAVHRRRAVDRPGLVAVRHLVGDARPARGTFGAWADTVPRRRLLVLGAALYTGCFALWTAVPTYAAFAGGFVLWGLSGSLVSGTYEAYVYDHLHARGRPRPTAG